MGDRKFEILVKEAMDSVVETQHRLPASLVYFRHQTDANVSLFNGGT